MFKMVIIGIFIGAARIFLQRKQLAKIPQTMLVYTIGMGAIFGLCSTAIDWVQSFPIHEILQIPIFLCFVAIIYLTIHMLMIFALPNNLIED